MNLPSSRQNGAALMVALVALIVLTIFGVTTMSDVMNQSSVVRNEQFRQSVFYAASSELNGQIDSVNRNLQSEDDVIIGSLLNTSPDGKNMALDITKNGEQPFLSSPNSTIALGSASITGDKLSEAVCDGEDYGSSVNMIYGTINVTAALDDGLGGIHSNQTQRYTYCWP